MDKPVGNIFLTSPKKNSFFSVTFYSEFSIFLRYCLLRHVTNQAEMNIPLHENADDSSKKQIQHFNKKRR